MTFRRGDPCVAMLWTCNKPAYYGRFLRQEGGLVWLVTPHGTVVQVGCLMVRELDDAGREQLTEYDRLAIKGIGFVAGLDEVMRT